LLVGFRVHDVNPVCVPIHDLQLLGVQPRLIHELSGAESVLEGRAGVEISHPGLDECPQIPRRPVGEFHDPAWLALKKDHVTPTYIGSLHSRPSSPWLTVGGAPPRVLWKIHDIEGI
jgi:hypothetical protein